MLLASSTGGHFTELEIIAKALEIPLADRHWVVPRTAQTTSRLASQAAVTWMPLVRSRDLIGAVRNLGMAVALHRRVRPRLVLSTGAAQAVPHLIAACIFGCPIRYIESAARLDGPSMTGKIAARLPRSTAYAPVAGWGRRWHPGLDVFSAFASEPCLPEPVTSAVVALGGERYQFPRAVRAARSALGPEVEVTWQVGSTDDLDGDALNRWLSPDEMAIAMSLSSVVITHGGAGSILTALGAGKIPVVIPRVSEHGEHCDDHQVRMCEGLEVRGLVVMVHPDEQLGTEHLLRAISLRAVASHQRGTTGLPEPV